MTWTATLREATKVQGILTIVMQLTDSVSGEVIFLTVRPTSLDDLKTQVRNYVQRVESSYAGFGLLPPIGTELDYSATVVPPPTPTFGNYSASALAMTKSASKNYLSLFNAHASLVVEVYSVKITQELTAAVTGFKRGYRLFRISAHSAGTTVTPDKLDSNYPDMASAITARANGQSATLVGSAVSIASLNEDETASGSSEYLLDPTMEPIRLRQNQGVLIQQDATAGVGLLSAVMHFQVR